MQSASDVASSFVRKCFACRRRLLLEAAPRGEHAVAAVRANAFGETLVVLEVANDVAQGDRACRPPEREAAARAALCPDIASEIVAALPGATAVFRRFGIDVCCKGNVR